MRAEALRLGGWGLLWIVLGFSMGRMAAASIHERGVVDPLAAWRTERDALVSELEALEGKGVEGRAAEVASRLFAIDPIHPAARRVPAGRQVGEGGRDVGSAPAVDAGPVVPTKHPEILALHVNEGRTLRAAQQMEARGEGLIARKLLELEAQLREAGSLLLASRIEAAHEKWRAAAALEGALLGGTRSVPLREMGVTLAGAWNQQAEQSFSRGQLREAAASWRRSREAHPAQVEAVQGEARIERESARLLAGRPRCSDLAEIVAATLPGSPSHEEAKTRMDETCESRAGGFLLYRHGD